VYFNMTLLDVAGTVHSKPETIESVQFFGRAVSAMGCVFLVLGFFAKDLFYFKTRLSIGVLSGLAIVCIMPFLMMMIFPMFHENASDVILALLPALGFYFIYVSKGANRYQTVVALMLM